MKKMHDGHVYWAFFANAQEGYACATCGKPVGMEPEKNGVVVLSGEAEQPLIGERSSGRAGGLSIQREAR